MAMDNTTPNTGNDILITKASGETELFRSDKLEQSLLKAGVNMRIAKDIVDDIKAWIRPGDNTKKIYTHAFKILNEQCHQPALRYNLKQAIFDLGPTGYPFEILIGELFKHKNFATEVGVVVDGYSISHEMDVVATKDNSQHLVECKYHKDQGKSVSIQVPLYVRSRVNDIIRKREVLPQYKGFNFTGWVVTNTRFSKDSTVYGELNELKLMSWDYPQGNGLKEIIEEFKIYPITILQHFTAEEKEALLDKGIVTCTQLLGDLSVLKALQMGKNRVDILVHELKSIGQ